MIGNKPTSFLALVVGKQRAWALSEDSHHSQDLLEEQADLVYTSLQLLGPGPGAGPGGLGLGGGGLGPGTQKARSSLMELSA